MVKKTLQDVNLVDKKVIVRFDFNVPLAGTKVVDDTRIKASFDTIKYLQINNAKIIILSHLGRVKTEADRTKKSLAPVAKHLSKLLKQPVAFVNVTRGEKLETAINKLKAKEILVVENTRIEDLDNKKESKNDPQLGKYWASLADVFVNDAFGTVHRAHASNVGIAKNIRESCIGLLVEKELMMLDKIAVNPKKPFVAILGGSKVSDKIAVIKKLLTKADKILIGGAMSYTFMSALGSSIGNSLVETNKISLARKIIDLGKDKLVVPIDHIISSEFKDVPGTNTVDENIIENHLGLDIGIKTQKLFTSHIQTAKTIFWNGPMGVFEMKNFAAGTKAISKAIAKTTNAFTLIGDEDSAAIAKFKYQDKFSFISTDDEALEYLEGKKLPGIAETKNI